MLKLLTSQMSGSGRLLDGITGARYVTETRYHRIEQVTTPTAAPDGSPTSLTPQD